jgi:hypothetical protein
MSRLPPPLPVMLDLAPLPRSQVGPFLILGVAKDADREALEANWAQRLIWARKNLIKVPLEDINWARELINDPDARLRADATRFMRVRAFKVKRNSPWVAGSWTSKRTSLIMSLPQSCRTCMKFAGKFPLHKSRVKFPRWN